MNDYRLKADRILTTTESWLNHPHICQIYDVGPDYLFHALTAPYKALRESPRWAKLAKMMNLPEA